ncbi:MAG: hypothetical protein V2J25_17105 [Desulfatiglans sp.]|jgi:hypothetical protein|nr:hypothetical protein [Thermodesulfobacteriota bacterium]MEE4354581.1 hypothetical protein [Desulfatiglans sp.]
MNETREFFLCDVCKNKDFSPVYNFSVRFHGVNFSNDLIYDQQIEELYQCTHCNKVFSKNKIEEGIASIRKTAKKD